MLTLTEKFASGKHRTVWRHPLDTTLCIKIPIPNSGKDDNANEHDYLHHLASRGVRSRHIPRTYGWVETDHGRGLILDLIRTPDGAPAPSLRSTLLHGQIDETKALRLINDTLDWAADNGVIVLDAGLQNFAVGGDQLSGGEWLVLIDGLGTYRLKAPQYRLARAFRSYEYWRARQKIKVRRNLVRQKISNLVQQRESQLRSVNTSSCAHEAGS